VIHDYYPRWVLHAALIGVLIGNTCEAAADIGGMAAALNVFVPIPIKWIAVPITLAILALQVWGSYALIRNIFRWLALSLLAYGAAAVLSKPDLADVIKGTLIPHIHFNKDWLSLLVAIIGTSLSAYIYTWQSNVEVEEEIEMGRTRLSQRRGATRAELEKSRVDVFWGIFFASVVMYFIMLSTSALFKAGNNEINSAAEAAQALKPLAGNAAGFLFALGVVAVGFLAVPIMTTGAAYDLSQAAGWTYGLYKKPAEAKAFYAAIAAISFIAMGLNFIGINPMKALVWAGIVQGFSTPPLMLLILLMTNRREIMGEHVNGRAMNVLGWMTTVAIFSATVGLIVTWIV
jgi:Mn2+/Fe2+ NRAMP family transporter